MRRGAQVYRQVDVQSAPKPQILDRLYGRCLIDIADATEAIGRRDAAAKSAAIDHAHRIVSELGAALDEKRAPELCANLAALYRFVLDRLCVANLEMTVEPLAQATTVLEELRESFRQASTLQ